MTSSWNVKCCDFIYSKGNHFTDKAYLKKIFLSLGTTMYQSSCCSVASLLPTLKPTEREMERELYQCASLTPVVIYLDLLCSCRWRWKSLRFPKSGLKLRWVSLHLRHIYFLDSTCFISMYFFLCKVIFLALYLNFKHKGLVFFLL